MEDIEIWKDIIGYEGLYMISSFGRVKSLVTNEKILKNSIGSHGYYRVNLSKNNKVNLFNIHILVAINFLNHKPNGYKIVVDHHDNNRLNNHVSNLQLITQRKNSSKDRKNCSSIYTGVCWDKKNNKWKSAIKINGKVKHLGCFDNEHDAYEAYKKALDSLNLFNID